MWAWCQGKVGRLNESFAEEPDIVRRCQLAAGTIFDSVYPAFKLGKMWLESPVDRFELIAHRVRVWLTDTYKSVERVARATEEALGEGLKAFPQDALASGADVFWLVSNYGAAQKAKENPLERLLRRLRTSENNACSSSSDGWHKTKA